MKRDLMEVLADPVRLSHVKAADLLDTLPDPEFDRLAQLAARLLHAPVALMTIVDADRQFFKSCLGLPEPWQSWRQSPLSHSFCQHVVATAQPLIIEDARKHPRLRNNPAINDLGVVAYLGIPLVAPDDTVLGSFCVIDHEPRQWDQDDVYVMQQLARSVLSEIELRRHRSSLEAMVSQRTDALRQAHADLEQANRRLVDELDTRRRMEDQLREALDAARVANQAKDRFLAMLSHELRTPLTPVLLWASSMEQDAGLSSNARETFVLIRQQVELEARLIEDLLDVTALARGKLTIDVQSVDVQQATREAIRTLAGDAARKEIAIDFAPDAQQACVLGDSRRLQQAITNILHNAIKFSAAGGKVRVRVWNQRDGQTPGGARRSPAEFDPPPWICIAIHDDGEGIEPSAIQRIFDPFEQASHAATQPFGGGGVGLGLPIARALVEAHGGRIEAHSPGRGRGATFTLFLRACENLPVGHALPTLSGMGALGIPEPAGTASEKSIVGAHVLVVEDDPQTARAMASLLRGRRYDVRTASSVAEAVRLLHSGAPADALVCDISLGDGNGTEVMREARRLRPSIRGIAVTGHGTPADHERTRAAGFHEHLTKPVNVRQLDESLRRLLTEPQA